MPFLLRRLLETFGSHFALSFIFSLLFHFGLLPQTKGMVLTMMILCIILILVYTFICLKGYLVSVDSFLYYFVVNYFVLLILCAVAITLAANNVEPLYTFLFFPFKLLNTVFDMSKTTTAIISSIFLFVFVAIAPFFMTMPPVEPEFEEEEPQQ